ncbi:GNAT family N-acetyltransferase [Sphingomonas lenta]|uniref:GNAT family N-acetyltransferase n=1 Tax=Sphingomonas lenta TaxID=1141887 RepID=A0A2A2SIN2_9SPHN|nr:GNAT family N-acetyltransferase [Sphingomonas lenta]PAX09089.1 GNAT family N-acetyltransferase [Sphingomonas lenta]
MAPDLKLRLATEGDISAIDELIARSVHGLQAKDYTQEQRDAALGQVFLTDRGLIADRTYFVVETKAGDLVGAGGWSDRRALHGGHTHSDSGERVDPAKDAARIRAYFVDPAFARQGVASAILAACEAAARRRGFSRMALGATLTGVPFYARRGYVEHGREQALLPNAETLTVVLMERNI